MDTKNYEPVFQLVANTIKKIELENSIINISNTQDLHRNFSINMKNILIESHDDYKSAGLDIEVIATIQEKIKENPRKFEIKLSINGIFTDSIETSNDDFEAKLKINGVAALYSIARGCITNISSQALAEGKVVLPLVNFIEASKHTNG